MALWLLALFLGADAVTFADLESVTLGPSLAESFKVSLVRPEGEPPNSGQSLWVKLAELLRITCHHQCIQ
eukprot:g27020.t1